MYGDKWVQITQKFHIRAKDISTMKAGEKVELLTLDRNFCDFLGYLVKKGKIEKGKEYEPLDIFSDTRKIVTYEHGANLQGKIKWEYYDDVKDFEFHVEYKNNHWFPLKDGRLPMKLMKREGCDKCYNSTVDEPASSFIQKDGRIGWRGPMIKKENLKILPKFFL